MFAHPTTLVLGAGASFPYGFPLGYTLTESIIKMPSERFDDWNVSTSAADRFKEAFKGSRAPSIDSFLSEKCHEAHHVAGKGAIAAVLLECESGSKLSTFDWYDLFADALISQLGDGPPRVTVITFNYDRSLEVFLHGAIKHRLALSAEEAWKKLVDLVEFVHVYGDLGALNDDGPRKEEFVPFGKIHPIAIQRAANSIKVVPEGRTDLPTLVRAREALTAEFVCFLGFGYAPENVERLQFDGGGKGLLSSGKGITIGMRYRIRRAFAEGTPARPTTFHGDSAWIVFGHDGMDAIQFLRFTDFFTNACTPNCQFDPYIRHIGSVLGQ